VATVDRGLRTFFDHFDHTFAARLPSP
jgi:hypothetical protein